jgi:hypothetical protein
VGLGGSEKGMSILIKNMTLPFQPKKRIKYLSQYLVRKVFEIAYLKCHSSAQKWGYKAAQTMYAHVIKLKMIK